MEAKKRPLRERMHVPSFDVTCVIGTVVLERDGEHTPNEAAFLLIARHDAPGTYTFPAADGDTYRVTVERDANG